MADIHLVVAPDAGSALQALTATTILRVPHSALRGAARLHPAIAEAFLRESSIDASVLATWIVNIGARDGLSRTAHLLCELACRYESTGVATGFQSHWPQPRLNWPTCSVSPRFT
jgi:CRP-like cAMP-binding protein